MSSYLDASHGLASWLLTRDHKRIAVLYLVAITIFFFIGGLMAVAIRLELATPQGDFVDPDTYNKLFTLHGVIMVFLFLIPSIPAVFGNFFIPLMIGARDLAFPRVNLLSWYLFMIGGALALYAMLAGGVDTGWTFYTPYSSAASNTHVIPTALGIFVAMIMTIALISVFARGYAWTAIVQGMIGTLFMLYGSILLIVESRMALGAIMSEMDFVWKVSQKYAGKEVTTSRGGPFTWLGKKI